MVVFAHSLRYLKDRAIKIIRDITGDEKYNEKDIRWVITVPAIWRPADKQFMREAACKVIVEKLNLFVPAPPPPQRPYDELRGENEIRKGNTGRARIQVTLMLSVTKHECVITNVKVLFFSPRRCSQKARNLSLRLINVV